MNWWLRLTSAGWDQPARTIEQRELVRRSQLASWIILAFLILAIVLLPLGAGDPSTLVSIGVFFVGLVLAAFLNRQGLVHIAAWLIIVLVWLGVVGALLGQPDGKLTLDSLPGYDLLVMTVIVAASLVSPRTATIVGVVNVAIICLDFFAQPHASDLQQDILYYGSNSAGALALLARPVALEIMIAGVALLWAGGMLNAIRRADRAEEIAELERREAVRNRELEEGVRQLLEVHVRLANGDFNTRAQGIRNQLLWQIGNSLNNLIARLARFAQADFILRRTQEESRRLSEAIYAYSNGRPPIWPAPSNTPLDQVVDALRRSMGGHGAEPRPSQQDPGSMPYPSAQLPPSIQSPGSLPSFRAPGAPSQPQPSNAGLPDWLRPLMPGGEQLPAQPMSPQPVPPSPAPQGNGANPWALDPEANLPDWLRQPFDDDSGSY